MKCLIVDDSEERTALIKDLLASLEDAHRLEAVYCDTADRARSELVGSFDLMLLDVLIPKKRNGTPQALHSVSLLADICNPKKSYIRPRLIIGLTADLNELGVYQEQFAKEATVVLRGGLTDLDWLDSFESQVVSALSTERKISKLDRDRLLVTVHGIRTYGHWQTKISDEVLRYSRSFDNIEVKYGFTDLFCFAIPPLRRKIIEREAGKLQRSLSLFSEREIHIIAHSFGTLIVSHALRMQSGNLKIKNIVFCGSPLPVDEDIEHVVRASEMTVNDCGIHDIVLIGARLFFFGLGDAGRIGFRRENSERFQNRFFRGGHDLYFKNVAPGAIFYSRYWLPTITLGKDLKRMDLRKNYIGEDFVDISIKFLTLLKPAWYFGAIILIWVGIGIFFFH